MTTTNHCLLPYTRVMPDGTRETHAVLVRGVDDPAEARAVVKRETAYAPELLRGDGERQALRVEFGTPLPVKDMDAVVTWMEQNAPEGELAAVEP